MKAVIMIVVALMLASVLCGLVLMAAVAHEESLDEDEDDLV